MAQDALSRWRQFCSDLASAGEQVLSYEANEREQAEGMRYLSRLMRVGLEMHLESKNPDYPEFYQASHRTAKIGADNPDNYYQNATISGDRSYRIYGHRGSVPILSFATKANRYAVDGTMASTGELDVRDMTIAPDGSFEIIVSRERPAGADNWLGLEEDSSMVLVRQTFHIRSEEESARVEIEAIDPPPHDTELELQSVSDGLKMTTDFVSGTAQLFIHWAETFKANNFNSVDTVDQTMFFKAGGDPTIYYLHGWWELEKGEALVIKTRVPVCEGWNFQLNNIWMESLDYRYHTIHTNNKLANYNEDGSVTIVVSETDPGFGNWLKTCGHTRGTMLFRWTGADEHPVPETTVEKLT
ncbi:MAG: DUF1214 domain-containing protein [Parvibaculales bacterium]